MSTPSTTLNIEREIAAIRGQKGQVWLAEALRKVQDSTRQLAASISGLQTATPVTAAATTTPAATAAAPHAAAPLVPPSPFIPALSFGGILTNNGLSNVALAVGENGEVLTADSTQPDGIAWEAIPLPTMVNVLADEIGSLRRRVRAIERALESIDLNPWLFEED